MARTLFAVNEESFEDDLFANIKEIGAALAFDATGGGNEGKLAGQILSAMEGYPARAENTRFMAPTLINKSIYTRAR